MNILERLLWKSGIASPPIENVPQKIVRPFEFSLLNIKGGQHGTWIDWNGNSVAHNKHCEAVEFILPWKFLLKRSANAPSSYTFMADYSTWLVEHLQKNGKVVVPIVNFGSWMSQPPRKTSHRISWHSRGSSTQHLHLKIGTYANHVSIDTKGFSGWSAFAARNNFDDESLASSAQHFNDLSESTIRDKISKYAQPTIPVVSEEGGYIFLALQMPGDVVSKIADITTVELLKFMARISSEMSKQVVIKRHPMCKNRQVSQIISNLKNHHFLKFSDGNIHDLIAQSDMVITVNSGVGAEALLHRKPVITTGSSDYGQATKRVFTFDELKDAIMSPHKGMDKALLEKFMSAYTRNYMVKFKDDVSLQKHHALINFMHG